MLVLSRKAGEKVRVGDVVTVTVLAVQGSRVRLGFTGPEEVPIQRDEVARRADQPESETVCAVRS